MVLYQVVSYSNRVLYSHGWSGHFTSDGTFMDRAAEQRLPDAHTWGRDKQMAIT